MLVCLNQKVLDENLNTKFLVEVSEPIYEIVIALNDRVHISADTVGTLDIYQLNELFLESFIRCHVWSICKLRAPLICDFDSVASLPRCDALIFDYLGLDVGNQLHAIVGDVIHSF